MSNTPPSSDITRHDQLDHAQTSFGIFGPNRKKCTSNEVVCFRRFGEEDASGICSPPLWKISNPHQNVTDYSQLSPDAKARAVARGQEELMEMIKNMPESCYELSLKDIVEHNNYQRPGTPKTYERLDEDGINGKNSKINPLLSKKKADGIMKRSGSLNNGGFLLKIVFPFDFRSKGKKRVILNETKLSSSKVSPRSSSVRASDGFSWFGENESIRRTNRRDSKWFGSCRSSSRTNSENNSQQQPSGIFLPGCWPVFSFKKSFYEK